MNSDNCYSMNSNNSYSMNSDNSYSMNSNNSYSMNSNNSYSMNSSNNNYSINSRRAPRRRACGRTSEADKRGRIKKNHLSRPRQEAGDLFAVSICVICRLSTNKLYV